MASWRIALIGATVSALCLVAVPASARSLTVEDPAGDASGRGLDITSVTVRNNDRAVVSRVELVAAVGGDLIVSIDPRGARGVRLVSERSRAGEIRNYVVPFSFSDLDRRRAVRCRGFRVRWNEEPAVVTMRMPSRCLRGGDYGAIRFGVLTERRAGDTDWAPENSEGDLAASRWIPRG